MWLLKLALGCCLGRLNFGPKFGEQARVGSSGAVIPVRRPRAREVWALSRRNTTLWQCSRVCGAPSFENQRPESGEAGRIFLVRGGLLLVAGCATFGCKITLSFLQRRSCATTELLTHKLFLDFQFFLADLCRSLRRVVGN